MFEIHLDRDGTDIAYAYDTLRDAEDQFETFKADPLVFSVTLYCRGKKIKHFER